MNPRHLLFIGIFVLSGGTAATAQSSLYPHHFDLSEVTLLDSPYKTAMDLNIKTLLEYDADRLLTPFVRQAGLNTGQYANWVTRHPIFTNWGNASFDLSGHVGGHYLTARVGLRRLPRQRDEGAAQATAQSHARRACRLPESLRQQQGWTLRLPGWAAHQR